MITRIVKMTFEPTKVEEFLEVFNNAKEQIRTFEGNCYLELIQDIHQPNILFTYSKWEDESDLENYRRSELFATTWAKTKVLFAGKPEAWSVETLYKLN